jgi:Na+/proline symporter
MNHLIPVGLFAMTATAGVASGHSTFQVMLLSLVSAAFGSVLWLLFRDKDKLTKRTAAATLLSGFALGLFLPSLLVDHYKLPFMAAGAIGLLCGLLGTLIITLIIKSGEWLSNNPDKIPGIGHIVAKFMQPPTQTTEATPVPLPKPTDGGSK